MKYAFTFVLALLIVLAACSAPSSQEQDTQTETQTDASADANVQADADVNIDADTTTVGELVEERTGQALDDLMDIARNYPLEFMVVYDLSGSNGADGEMTTYYKRTNVRYDMESQGMQTRTLVLDEVITSCTKMEQLGPNWNCFEMNAEEAMEGIADVEIDESDVEDASVVTSAGTMQVAGVTTTCFTTEYDDGTQNKMCFSAEGVMLYSLTTSAEGETTELRATQYSTSVSDSAFVLPEGASTQNMGDMPAFDLSNLPQY